MATQVKCMRDKEGNTYVCVKDLEDFIQGQIDIYSPEGMSEYKHVKRETLITASARSALKIIKDKLNELRT